MPPPAPPLTDAAQPVATGMAMKERNPVLVWLLWPFLTLGIYHLVWYYKNHREMAEFDRRRAVPIPPTCSGALGVLLTFVLGVNILYFQIELNRVVDRYAAPEGTLVSLFV